MDARARFLVWLILLLPTLGASARSTNFLVTAPTPAMATELARAAETMRRDLAREWLGHELPAWREVCPVVAKVDSQLGAGGRTSFVFHGGEPGGWDMEVQGSYERILDSVLPHEITHTVFATHFGRPLPRWADEGACTTVEHRSERRKQEVWLVRFLKTERGIPFNQMFAMTEYPGDILPLYSQGYSVTRYLITQGGKPKFVAFVGQGMQTNNWPAAVHDFYGFESLGALQLTWLDWVVHGSRDPQPQPQPGRATIQLASTTPPAAGTDATALATEALPPAPRSPRPRIDDQLAYATSTDAVSASTGRGISATSERSWYAQRQVPPSPSRTQPTNSSIRR
jgi:hypothetical protein